MKNGISLVVPSAPVHLHRPPRDVVQHRRHHHLGRGDVLTHPLVVVVLVYLPGRVQHEEAELDELSVGICDVALHELLVGQDASLGLTAQGPLAHHVQSLLGHADRAHRVMDPAATEAGLRDDEGHPFPPEQGFLGHPHILIVDEGVEALVEGLPVETDVPLDVDARCRGRNQEHRHALVGADVRIGHGHHDEERGGLGVRGEVLPSVDHPFVAVLDRPGLEHGRIGAGVRLGHRERREHLAVQQRLEVTRLLLRCPVVGDDLCVAGVGSLRAEHRRRPR